MLSVLVFGSRLGAVVIAGAADFGGTFAGSTVAVAAFLGASLVNAAGGGWLAISSSMAAGRDIAGWTAGVNMRALRGFKSGCCREVGDDRSGPGAGGNGSGGLEFRGAGCGGMSDGRADGPCAGDGGVESARRGVRRARSRWGHRMNFRAGRNAFRRLLRISRRHRHSDPAAGSARRRPARASSGNPKAHACVS